MDVGVEIFEVFDAAHPFQAGEPAATVEPADGALDNSTLGQHDEVLDLMRSFDNLDFDPGEDAGPGAVKDRPFIGAVGEQFSKKGEQPNNIAVAIDARLPFFGASHALAVDNAAR